MVRIRVHTHAPTHASCMSKQASTAGRSLACLLVCARMRTCSHACTHPSTHAAASIQACAHAHSDPHPRRRPPSKRASPDFALPHDRLRRPCLVQRPRSCAGLLYPLYRCRNCTDTRTYMRRACAKNGYDVPAEVRSVAYWQVSTPCATPGLPACCLHALLCRCSKSRAAAQF